MIEFFTAGLLRGSRSDLASSRMLLLLGGVSLVLALTQLFLFVSPDFSRITFFLFKLTEEVFPMRPADPPAKSLFVKTTEAPELFEAPSMRSVSRIMSRDMSRFRDTDDEEEMRR